MEILSFMEIEKLIQYAARKNEDALQVFAGMRSPTQVEWHLIHNKIYGYVYHCFYLIETPVEAPTLYFVHTKSPINMCTEALNEMR